MNRKHGFVTVLLFCCFMNAAAQDKKLSGPYSGQLLSAGIKDSIDAMNDLADTLCLNKDEKGYKLAANALQLSKQIQYHIGIGDASHSLGLTQFRRDNDSAIYYFKQARNAYLKEFPGFEKMAFALNNLSRTYYELLQFDSSLHYAQVALAFVQKNHAPPMVKSKWLMYTYGAIANTYGGQSRYDSCNIYYLKAIALAEKANHKIMLNVYFKGLSGIQSRLGDYEKAALYAKKAVSYIENDCGALSIGLANLGGIYSRLKDFVNADKMADSSIKVGRYCNVWNSVGRNYSILGNSQMEQKNFIKALAYFKTGMKEALLHHNSKTTLGILYRRLGDAYEALDSLPQARDYYLKTLKTVEGDHEMMNAVYLSLSHLSFKEGDINSAYHYLKQYNAFKDTVYTNEKIKIITELNTRYETEKKDQHVLLLSKEKELQQALLDKQLQQIAKDKAEKREQELEISNYRLQTDKQDQLLQIQYLDIAKNKIAQSRQQSLIANAAIRLENEQKEKIIAQNESKDKQNWLLLLMAGFIIMSLIFFLVFSRYKLMKKIQSQEALFKQRELIGRELHDEVGATLSGIAMYSHLAKEQAKKAEAGKIENSLSIIQTNAGEMVNKLNDIVWLLNPAQDTLQKLIQRLEEYAGEMTAIKNMHLKTQLPPQFSAQNLPVESRRNIYLFCKEAINNAVKYSEATLLELTVKENNGVLEITVNDNGKGFDIENIKRGNGLDNMKKRADELGAGFNIQSAPGRGCQVSLTVKITQ